MTTSTPMLALLYPLVTDTNEFKRFRNDADGYLQQHGISAGSPAYASFIGVSRGGTQTRKSLDPVVKAVLEETDNGETGPSGELGAHLPLLGAFYRKYVQGQDVAWGPYPSIQDALGDEVFGTKLVW